VGWCEEHLQAGCLFGEEAALRDRHCPERSGGTCTLVNIMLAVHEMPRDLRRRLITALYPAYGIGGSKPPGPPPSPRPRKAPR
jgi:hypothetical protein